MGQRYWKKAYLKQRVSNIVSRSDEAFTLVTLENNWDRWVKLAEIEAAAIAVREQPKKQRREEEEEEESNSGSGSG